jgi:DNA-binding IclR family transcriptional regulator
VFLAWGPPAAIDAWLGRLGADATSDERELHRLMLDWVRERGFAVGLEVEARAELGRTLVELTDRPHAHDGRARVERIVARLGREYQPPVALRGEFDVSYVAAPVFGPSGEVVLALSAIGFRAPLTVAELDRVSARLRRATVSITAETHGRPPPAP